jgi:type IV pilus assembly protein PilM
VFRRGKSIVGLDLGSQVIKAVEITLEGPEPVITGFARVEIQPGADRAAALAEAFNKGRFRSKSVVTSVSGQSVVVRYVSMPRMSDNELRQAIRIEADRYVPFELDEVKLDCQPLKRRPQKGSDGGGDPNDKEQMSVLLVACRMQTLEEQIKAVLAEGLSPQAIDVDVFALANAWELCGLPEEPKEGEQERGTALIDVGHVRTSINVLSDGETCFSREIGIGGHDMTQAVSRRLGIELFEAEALKRNPGEQEPELQRAIAPVLEDLTSEITLSLDFVEHHDGLRVEEILLSGGGALAPGAVTYIEQATARSTRIWNPIEGLRIAVDRVDVEELEAWASSLAVAVGLASRVRAA